GTERPFDANAVQLAGTRPSLWRPQHNHWPARLAAKSPSTGFGLDVADAVDRRLQRRAEFPVDRQWLVSLDETRIVPVPREQVPDLLVGLASQDGRGRDLVTVEVQDGQHGAIAFSIQEADALP